MKFAADECCDALLVAGLRSDGHDVWCAQESARGWADELVLQHAFASNRILLTEDKDFGHLVVRLGLPAIGIVLLRLHPEDTPSKLARLRELLRLHADRLTGSFIVIDASRVRIRPLRSRP